MIYKPDSDKLAANDDEMSKIIRDSIQVGDYGEGAELSCQSENIEDYPIIFNYSERDAPRNLIIGELKLLFIL